MAQQILRLPEVKKRAGLSRASIYALIAQGRFPKQIKLSERAVGWLSTEIDSWVEARVTESRSNTSAAA